MVRGENAHFRRLSHEAGHTYMYWLRQWETNRYEWHELVIYSNHITRVKFKARYSYVQIH